VHRSPQPQRNELREFATHSAWVLWLVGVTALLVRLAVAILLDGLRHPHVEEYDLIARNLVAGRGFTYFQHGIVYYSVIAPLPAWLSAASYWLTDTLVLAMLVQIVAGAALAPLTAILAQRLFGGWRAPLAAGMLVAFHPGLAVYSASRAHSLPFDSLFFMLALLQCDGLVERPTFTRASLLGITVGIGVLSRVTVLLFLPISFVWLLVRLPSSARRTALWCACVATLCAAAVVAPWSARNSLLHGRFVFLLTTDSEVFWRGNNPSASGTSFVDATHTVLGTLSPEDARDLARQPNEIAQADWFKTRARAFIREHPAAFVRLTLLKFFYFWWYAPATGLFYPRTWFRLYLAYYVGALLLAALGVSLIARGGGRRTSLAWLVGAFLLSLASFQSLYYVEGRHRWAVEPMILVFSGGGVASLLVRRRDVGAV
jgi:4-amino-4-deoxy-L-arabinose transferase-like glycosyltransferase